MGNTIFSYIASVDQEDIPEGVETDGASKSTQFATRDNNAYGLVFVKRLVNTS